MEKLDRGGFASIHKDGVFLSWRLLSSDPEDVTFNILRNGEKINELPVSISTFYIDKKGSKNEHYTIVPLHAKREMKAEKDHIQVSPDPWNDIKLNTPKGYFPNDASVGDLDGDGDYEIVLHQMGRGRDNAQSGETTAPVIQAYKTDGTMLWEINLGKNIREGAHYTQFLVYDFDADGRAEIACKTADGTVDGCGKIIGNPDVNHVGVDGKILSGPEFLTIFDGLSGKALATVDYIPSRYPTDGWGGIGGNAGNDSNGNRADRFLACVAYLDGIHPSFIMCRGYYGRSVLAAWDWKNGILSSRWIFDSSDPGLEEFSGMGNHNLSVADVDRDGRDEIIYGSMTIDDNGKGLYSTKLRHGDALHVSDFIPERAGLEVWGIHENEVPVKGYEDGFGAALFDAANGEILWGKLPGTDVGRGVAAEIDSTSPGAEMWCSSSRELWNNKGEVIGEKPASANFLIWWDGDLTRELLDKNCITKYKGDTLLYAKGFRSINGSKATPVLSADLFGDWREEVIFASDDGSYLRIFTSPIPTGYRITTLMQDPQYRLSIAWQNVAYNQPPHTGFFLGHAMEFPVKYPAKIQFPK